MAQAWAAWKVQVDWGRDGDFSDLNDDISRYVVSVIFNCGFRQAFTDVADTNKATIVLMNDTRRFSPEYTSGPLYGSHWKLRPVRITAGLNVVDSLGNQVVDGTGNPVVIERVLWSGWTDDIKPSWNRHQEPQAILTCTGPKRFFDNAKVYIPLQLNKRSDEVIQAILDEVTIPPAVGNGPWALGVPGYSELGVTTYLQNPAISASLEQGRHTFEYAADTWQEGITAIQAIAETVKVERGRFFFDRDGRAVFWNRHHLMKKTTVDDTITDTMQGATYAFGANHANVVSVSYKPRELADEVTTLWVLNDPIRIKKGETKEIRARFSEQDSDSKISGVDVVKPNVGDGTLVVTAGAVLIRRWKVDARGAQMKLKPTGNRGCTITKIEIRGRKLTSYNDTTIEVRDGESDFHDGPETYPLSLPMLNDGDEAQRIAEYELARRKTPRGEIQTLKLRAVDDTSLLRMLELTVGSRITINEAQTGHSGDYFIVGEEHSLSDALRLHDVTWTLEPASTQEFWILGVSTLGETTVLAPI